MQRPHGPEDLYCPFWRKPMSKVCHTCPMWVHVRGTNKNTGEDVDRWDCSVAQTPLLLIETANAVRGVDGTVGELRKENMAIGRVVGNAIMDAARLARGVPRLGP